MLGVSFKSRDESLINPILGCLVQFSFFARLKRAVEKKLARRKMARQKVKERAKELGLNISRII
ncbi:hypothetical protein DRO54_02960 [Candidatus Bathyarchaeota archaeon]|nr:MAG: hypothetical protein DRO54_02960 [Candidatus Bathyarchaeota archaeon]